MNKKASICVDVMFVCAIACAFLSIASHASGDGATELNAIAWACFCLLMAMLFCMYPRKRA